jgi:hypothetical protein
MTVSFRLPADSKWKAATQLFSTDDPLRFTAPNLQYFMDSPVELSDHAVREWRVMSPAGSFPVRVAMHHQGSEAELDAYVEKLTRVVEQQVAVFGTTPQYDVRRYTFIADYLPWASGTGCTASTSHLLALPRDERRRSSGRRHSLPLVERRADRPRSLNPFDFAGQHVGALVRGGLPATRALFLRRAAVASLPVRPRPLGDRRS